MSNPGGRPHGSKNQPGHSAGGFRPGAGRPEAKKRKADGSALRIPSTMSSESTSHASFANIEASSVMTGSGPQDRIHPLFGGGTSSN